MPDPIPMRRALLSVSDKTGLAEFAASLVERGVELLSTGGSAETLRSAGLEVTEIADLTGFPEMMDGRVKTLHPVVHGGLLALRDNADHIAASKRYRIDPIDLLVVNLYPFEETVAKGAPWDECVENIDIGGPAMIRAAAKNHAFVTVVVDIGDYDSVLAQLAARGGGTDIGFRRKLAQRAFARTAAYDAAVSNWMADAAGDTPLRRHNFAGTLLRKLRYGENPHQTAAFYSDGSMRPGVATAVQCQGAELSYNNINDTDSAYGLVSEFRPEEGSACVIVKHANPCGVARGSSPRDASIRAFACARTSAFGGIVAFNQPLDEETAEAVCDAFTEVIIAPDADAAAKRVLAKRGKLRLLTAGRLADPEERTVSFRQVSGGFLVQDGDWGRITPADLRVVTERAPTEPEIADLMFAWIVAKHVKSNAIVYARDGATVGIGAGQMSRVDSSAVAALKAGRMAVELGLSECAAEGSVVASDAFFPFPDGLLAAARVGARAVIQPGGSVRDEEVIAAADEAGLAMVLTGMRHFRH